METSAFVLLAILNLGMVGKGVFGVVKPLRIFFACLLWCSVVRSVSTSLWISGEWQALAATASELW